MKKTMIITLEIEVEDLSPESRKDAAVCEGCTVRELPSLNDATFDDFRDIISGCIENSEEAFGGSMVYAKFNKATVIDANWKREPKKHRGLFDRLGGSAK